MIECAVSHGYGEENRHVKEITPESIQLALFKYELYEKYKSQIWDSISQNHTHVKVVHLPIDTLREEFKKSFVMIEECSKFSGCINYVIHPNRSIKRYLGEFLNAKLDVNICVENFQWKKNKALRSPLEIIEFIMEYDNMFLTFDTSHAEEVWFDHRILPYILKYTQVIHLSNRSKEYGQHLPFNSPNGELNLVKFVKDLKYKYKWSGIIALEYMEDYQNVIIKNYEYLKTLVR